MSNTSLIINHSVFHAFLCYLIETNQADALDELCEISLKLDKEIKKRKINQEEIDNCIKTAILNPKDRLMVNWFIFPEIINPEVGIA
tara:strand:- start:442 stop:702 length:261 start_codon:yes stop_codon:yes gene_type:complete